jgi:uncharacterized phiE125 gp8 family phage protein
MMNPIVTVTSAAPSYDLTTLANVKSELDISDGANDAVLRRYINSASVAAANYCNRVFAVETVSEQFLPGHHRWRRHQPKLQLARFPLITVTSVTEDGVVLTVDTDYIVNARNGQLTRVSGGVPISWLNLGITVVYSSGYVTVPPDLEDAVIRMVTQRYSTKGRDLTVRKEAIPGVIEVQYQDATAESPANITPDVAALLERYCSPVVG